MFIQSEILRLKNLRMTIVEQAYSAELLVQLFIFTS